MANFEFQPNNECVCGATLDFTNKMFVKKHFSKGIINFQQCNSCFSYIQSPKIKRGSLIEWYNSDDYHSSSKKGIYINYSNEEEQRQKESLKRYESDLINYTHPKSKILEIGCATGSLLNILKINGHQIHGVDISSYFCHLAKELNNIHVVESDILNYTDEKDFDFVIMLGTISNLYDINESLSHIKKILKPKGKIYFNMPYYGSIISKIYSSNYWMFTPSIINFMTVKGVIKLLENSGFNIIDITTDKQCPTFGKVIAHMQLHKIYSTGKYFKIHTSQLPFNLPIPGIKRVVAEIV